jgi:HD-GYP domain-containing protein (c-di-GMP phosphodiesterase class II)
MPWYNIDKKVLCHFSTLPVDIYISLSANKYVKLSHANEILEEAYKKYVQDPEALFCIRSEDHEKLSLFLSSNLPEDINIDENISEINEVASVLNAFIKTFKLNEDIVRKVETITKSVVSTIEKDPRLEKYLELLNSNGRVMYQHCSLVSFLSVLIALSDKELLNPAYEKLATAGLIHEIGLSEDLFTKKELQCIENDDLAWQEIRSYKAHTLEGHGIVKLCPKVDGDIANLVLEHHEKPDGSGFPDGKSHDSLSRLSATFIVADNFALAIQSSNFNEKLIHDYFYDYKNKYYLGVFKQPIDIMAVILTGARIIK